MQMGAFGFTLNPKPYNDRRKWVTNEGVNQAGANLRRANAFLCGSGAFFLRVENEEVNQAGAPIYVIFCKRKP
jgi:hypothetical protein